MKHDMLGLEQNVCVNVLPHGRKLCHILYRSKKSVNKIKCIPMDSAIINVHFLATYYKEGNSKMDKLSDHLCNKSLHHVTCHSKCVCILYPHLKFTRPV